jgi:type II secretion system protein N
MNQWKELVRKYGKWVGYPLFYLFAFVFFLRLVFPYDKIRERIVATFNAQQRPGPGQQQLSIDEVGGWWLTGVRLKNVRIVSAPSEPGGAPTEMKIDEARAKIGVLAAIVGHTDISFRVDAFGGEIDGTYADSPKERAVEANLDGVDLSQINSLTDLLGLPVEGRANGKLALVMPEQKASKGSGTFTLDVSDVAIGDGKAKLKNALDWPKLAVGPLSITAEANDGVLKITKLTAGGKDLELSGEGKIQMRDLASESTVDVEMKFKINDSYRSKSKLTEALFGAPGTMKGGDVDRFVPKMKSAHRADGFYAFRLQGLLSKLEPKPDPMYGGAIAPSEIEHMPREPHERGEPREREPRERRGRPPGEPSSGP